MESVKQRLKEMKAASIEVRKLSSEVKNRVLVRLERKLRLGMAELLKRNTMDVDSFQRSAHFQAALVDRLTLTEKRSQQMGESLIQVAAMKDPVGEIVENRTLANGLNLQKVRSPLGIIFLIFEARPNVITEAFSLAFKAGNGLILKGGKESENSSAFIYQLILESLEEEGVDPKIFWGLIGASRDLTDFLMQQNQFIDVLIPRGGDRLIEHVTKTSTIPLIKNDRGLCHVYVHEKADFSMALTIIENAKTQRPSVCNAAETLLVDRAIASQFLPLVYERLSAKGVEFFLDAEAHKVIGERAGVSLAEPVSFDTEYLDLKLNIAVVENIKSALEHIETHGSRHSEAIVTNEDNVAHEFQKSVDAAAVYWNASTRFTDGGQFGLGAEIGISTQKLHVRGPVGLESLTSLRWIVSGQGQIRS